MKNRYIKLTGLIFACLLAVATFVQVSEVSASEKLMIPIGKSVAIPALGVQKILAVREGIVDVLNVSDEEIILSGIGVTPGITQLIIWDQTGRRVYDIETFSQNDIIHEKFASIVANPSLSIALFPDVAYLRGNVNSEDEKSKAVRVASSLIKDRPVVDLVEVTNELPTLKSRIEQAILLPNVQVNVVTANFDASSPGSETVATDTSAIRIVLHGTVENQNEYIHLNETVRGFVESTDQISNLVVIENPIQVVFQAYVLEVSKNNTRDLGIDWGGENSGPGEIGFLENISNHFRGDVQSPGAPVPSHMNPFKMNNINRFELIAAQVRAWETNGKAKVLANPKLTVYANASPLKIAKSGWLEEKSDTETEADIERDSGLAYVNIGRKIFYSTGSDISTGRPNYDEVDASLKLMIRDLYVNNDDLKFSVFAKQEEPSFTRGSTEPPDILRRNVMTTVQVNDQKTIVLGGLINRSDEVSWRGVPVLSNLPFLGRLFKTRSVSKRENELIILLTPQIQRPETNLAGNKRFETVPVPHRTDRLERLHEMFQKIRSSHLPAE